MQRECYFTKSVIVMQRVLLLCKKKKKTQNVMQRLSFGVHFNMMHVPSVLACLWKFFSEKALWKSFEWKSSRVLLTLRGFAAILFYVVTDEIYWMEISASSRPKASWHTACCILLWKRKNQTHIFCYCKVSENREWCWVHLDLRLSWSLELEKP